MVTPFSWKQDGIFFLPQRQHEKRLVETTAYSQKYTVKRNENARSGNDVGSILIFLIAANS